MLRREFGDVPDFAIDHDPAVLWRVVFRDFLDRDQVFVRHLRAGGKDKSMDKNGILKFSRS